MGHSCCRPFQDSVARFCRDLTPNIKVKTEVDGPNRAKNGGSPRQMGGARLSYRWKGGGGGRAYLRRWQGAGGAWAAGRCLRRGISVTSVGSIGPNPPEFAPPPRVGPPLGCLPRGGAKL